MAKRIKKQATKTPATKTTKKQAAKSKRYRVKDYVAYCKLDGAARKLVVDAAADLDGAVQAEIQTFATWLAPRTQQQLGYCIDALNGAYTLGAKRIAAEDKSVKKSPLTALQRRIEHFEGGRA